MMKYISLVSRHTKHSASFVYSTDLQSNAPKHAQYAIPSFGDGASVISAKTTNTRLQCSPMFYQFPRFIDIAILHSPHLSHIPVIGFESQPNHESGRHGNAINAEKPP